MSKQYPTPEPLEEQHKTRGRIIAAAAKVLAEKGYDATALRVAYTTKRRMPRISGADQARASLKDHKRERR